MQIDFYEEFPSKENLEKLRLVKWKIRVFVAAKSLEEFLVLEKQIKKIKKDTEVAYWPIIPNSYWISPLANTKDLKKLFEELDLIKNPLLIDLELPLKNRGLFFKNIFHLRKNKKLIKHFLEKNKSKITTAESPFIFLSKILKLLGLNYGVDYERSLMWYSSMLPDWLNKAIMKRLSKPKNKASYSVSLGTIATGILGSEPILSPENLEKDLEFCKSNGFKKVIIFRLGGLNKNYIKVLEKFAD